MSPARGSETAGPEARPERDAEARRRIREDLDATLFVEAAAGTGKTTELVQRIACLLASGRTGLERIVAVTFTEKAAGEMKLRLRAEIERGRSLLAAGETARTRLDAALGKLEEANIGTIHAFCADLLRTRPVEAGVDPLFEVASEDEQRGLLDAAFDSWWERTLADPPEGVRRVLRRRPRGPNAQTPRQQLRSALAALVEHRDFTAAWRREPFAREAGIDAVVEQLAELSALAGGAHRADDWLARNLIEIERFVAELRQREGVRGRDHDGLEAELRGLARSRSWRWRGGGASYGPGLPRAEVLARREEARSALEQLLEGCEADLAPLLRAELLPVLADYEQRKRRSGRLDFLDLLLRARDLVRDDSGVRADLQQRFSHFFVDEFQDTDPLQAEILLLLASDDPGVSAASEVVPAAGKLFLVGDPKQSIYRFRRADVAVYERTKQQLRRSGAEVLQLTTSFRSVPSLQCAVNAAFEPWLQGSPDGSQASYVPLEPARPEAQGRPSLIALPVPRPWVDYGNRARITQRRIEESLPDAVGAFVDWLVRESGWTVTNRERADAAVPIQARHVCLLFRRFKRFRDDVTRPYVRALEARRVPHVLVGGRSFHDREEVLALRNALVAIEWPDDELRLFATLRGPLFAFADDTLLAFRQRVGSLHPLRPAQTGLDPPEQEVAAALEVLAGLHRERNRRPIAETVTRLLEAVRAHAGIAIWPTGEQALANCLRVVDLARRFERRGATSFRGFVERLEADAERGEAEEAPVVEEGTEGVRIMTVHKAKGLEFPVVILADPTCSATREPPTRRVDPERRLWAEALCGCAPLELLEQHEVEARRDREEAVRLAYVAATRARDLLVVPTCGDEEVDGWIAILNPVLHPEAAARRRPRKARGCPDFGDDSVVERPSSAPRGAAGAVAPGLHRPRLGSHEVVWWDPHALELDRDEQVGLRQQRILEADAEGRAVDEGERAHRSWQQSLAEARDDGGMPSLQVETITALAEAAAEPAAPASSEPVSVLDVPLDRRRRPRGRRFGTLVHATLAAVPLEADDAGVAAVATLQGRLVGASVEEVEAATAAVRAALEHPLLRAAARSAARGGLRRETPVFLRLEDGRLAEGVVDLAFHEEEPGPPGWVVVDFKTDQELEPRRAVYEEQVRLYARAVATATGEPARAVLLTV